MDKRGVWSDKFVFLYIILIILIFLALTWKISLAKDDTGYSLEFYAKA